jgi:CheY-like chemotaxis protein
MNTTTNLADRGKQTSYHPEKNHTTQKYGPIIVIEDDADDQLLLSETFQSLNYPNQVLFFSDGHDAIEYMEKTDSNPFLILSDINMPTIDGFELRDRIRNNEALKVRCIPYLFFTTGAQANAVRTAYSMSAQGFFLKPNSIMHLKNTIRKIVEYWQECSSPNHYLEVQN